MSQDAIRKRLASGKAKKSKIIATKYAEERVRNSPPNRAYKDPATNRFAKGNPGGKGNPLAKTMYANRQMIVNATDPKDAIKIWRSVIKEAQRGNIQAAKMFVDLWAGNHNFFEIMEIARELQDELESLRGAAQGIPG